MTTSHGQPRLRPFEAQDEEFSYLVYAGARAEEMALVDWPLEQKEAFLRMQFHAQHTHYHTHSPQAEWMVILQGVEPAGRLIVDRSPENQIALMDIALLPQFRGQGIGTALIKALMEEARTVAKAVVLFVEAMNPALRLYQRLGFQVVGEPRGIYLEMVWRPE